MESIAILTTLLNEITAIRDNFILVLDDYHVMEAQPVDAPASVDGALTFLLDHLPPQMHLVIATREDPDLPLARLRARGQLTELRAADLRLSSSEAADFLNQVMGLELSPEDVTVLETRTEGWIAGLHQEYVAAGKPVYLQTIGNLAFESMNFGHTLLMLSCCPGGILFYYLLYKSGVVPRALSLWGLITAFPMLIGTLTQIFGYTIPFIFYFPYVPFEFVIGVWILVRGVKDGSERATPLQGLRAASAPLR